MAASWLRRSDRRNTSSSSSSVSSWSPRSDLEIERRQRSCEPESESPPSYAVVEDSKGNLVSKALNVIWPERPEKGRYSLDEYKKRKARERELRQEKDERIARKRERRRRLKREAIQKSHIGSTASPILQSEGDHKSEINLNSTSRFVGVMAHSQLRRHLRPTQFCLYYARPETITSIAEVPIQMPLKLAYMSTSGKLYEFGFNAVHLRNAGRCWQLNVEPFNLNRCDRLSNSMNPM
ncbi:hypothetical protein Tcan_04127 [Toxocara canis]|uniref:Uncharacterized protein n=1 Tax=Toxocara canis TaxID=6265 RepID=A0A0B2VWD6_TOXCA|nr:hypothetical protein Tcan_04127 [Toxocara canis]